MAFPTDFFAKIVSEKARENKCGSNQKGFFVHWHSAIKTIS